MSSVKTGVPLPSAEKPGVDTKDDEGTKERKTTTSKTGNNIKKEKQTVGKASSLSEIEDVKAKAKETKVNKNVSSLGSIKMPSYSAKPSSIDNCVSTNANIATGEVNVATTTSIKNVSETAVSTAMSNETKPTSTPTAIPAATELATIGSTPPSVSKNIADPKIDLSATHIKKERTEVAVTKPKVITTASAMAPKQSQQHSHSKPHTQQQQQQHRYFVPSRQNQEEAVFKMVQNVFKLLETRGPLTMTQLEYNLPILIFGSSPSMLMSPQTINATASKTNLAVSRDSFTGGSGRDACNVIKEQNTDAKTSNNRNVLCEEKLIPGNMVPDIVELLVTLGVIQQQTNTDYESTSRGATSSKSSSAETDLSRTPQQQRALSAKNQLGNQPRFAVHFGKPKQFLVTPTNILSEIAKAQAEIQLSRQRQELLKEALNVTDQQAAERVKHIVLQHPQVVDDPVYVTALRNLQVDGMLMAGASGTTTAGNSNVSTSSTIRDGSSKPKSGVGGSGKKNGGVKRRQSNSTPGRRKRQRSKKDLPLGSVDVDSGSGKRGIAPSGSIGVGSKQTMGGSLALERSKQMLSARATSLSNVPSSTQPVAAVALTNIKDLKNT